MVVLEQPCGHDHSHGKLGDGEGARRPIDAGALVSGRGLRLTRDRRDLIHDVDIDIAPAEIVTLIGPNGAGKTTLVRVLLGLDRPDGGQLQRRPGLRVGYVPQRFDLDRAIPMTVGRFLQLGARSNLVRVDDALGEVGATVPLDQQISALSGGEFQRVMLARAVLRDPELLVLDEPTRGVDYAGEAELYSLIGHLRDRHGMGILLVSHDLHVVMASSDRVVCLNGHVCCSGVPETVAQHPEYARLFGAESARTLGLYRHHHDHSHTIAGDPVTPAPADRPGRDHRV